MRLHWYGLAVVFATVTLLSFVNGRAVYVRDINGLQRDFEEHEEEHWDGSAPLLLNTTWYSPSYSTSYLQRRQGTNPEWLRIMPLGASIVRGLTSSPEDGFRKPLRDHLRSIGFKVNMVGSQFSTGGSMRDGQHEGHSGHRIDQINQNLDRASGSKPNLYLINAGTNDCQQNYLNMQGTIGRLNDLLNNAWEKSSRATIILSTLLPSNNEGSNPGSNNRVNALNNEIRDLAQKLNSAGRRIQLADMNDGYITTADLVDGVHPNSPGYRKMAAVWMDSIQKALTAGMLQSPEDNGTTDDASANSCDKIPGFADGPHRTQKGYGFDDGPYVHKGTPMGATTPRFFRFPGRDASKRFGFGELVNRGGNPDPKGALDEFITWFRVPSQNQVQITYYVNKGDGTFETGLTVFLPFDCPSEDIRWADMNGDLQDDYVCVRANGDLGVALNTGLDNNGRPAFKPVSFGVPDHSGYEGRHVRLGDIDGDGRTDYCLLGDDGVTKCWRNGGLGDNAAYWQDFGVVFSPKGKGDIRGTRFVDLNGDGRSDWIWVGDTGDTDIYTNMRGPGPADGNMKSLIPYWLRATAFHGGVGRSGVRDEIHFARIYAKDVKGRRDYVWFEAVDLSENNFDFYMRTWRNDGSGGTQRKSDWNRYCDVSGDGKDDYLQIRPNGDVEMWGNIASPPEWKVRNIIINIGAVDPEFVHLADWNGDGKCDIIKVARRDGSLTVIPNTYDKSGGAITWGAAYTVDKRNFACDKQGWSPGIFDLAVRFADLNGDGRADYVCMDPNGRAEATLNLASDRIHHLRQIKFSEDKDRANHRFADVNGDGKDDFLWVDKWNGEVHVWYNEGVRTQADRDRLKGSIIEWTPKGKMYNGVDRGPNEYFMDYDGDGRADILRVNPTDNSAEVWYNKCNGGDAGGDDDNTNPTLPSYSPGQDTCPAEDLDLCTLIPGICDKPYHSEPDDPLPPPGTPPDRSDDFKLMRRANDKQVFAQLGNNRRMRLIFLAYPAWEGFLDLYRTFPAYVLRRFWRFIARECEGDTIEVEDISNPDDPEMPDGILLEVEHIIDRQIMQRWGSDVANQRLPSGAGTQLPAIPRDFLAKDGTWEQSFEGLAEAPAISPRGLRWDKPNERVMECFGTGENPYPLMLVDKRINGAKGRIMAVKQPVDVDVIEGQSRRAIATGNRDDMDIMLDSIRTAFAVFDYMNSPEAALRFNQVRQNVRIQFGYIEQATGQENLVAWWDAWSTDFFDYVGTQARQWAIDAIDRAGRPYVELQEAGNPPANMNEVFEILEGWIRDRVPNMRLPPDTSQQDPGSPRSPGSRERARARMTSAATTG